MPRMPIEMFSASGHESVGERMAWTASASIMIPAKKASMMAVTLSMKIGVRLEYLLEK